MTVTALVSTAYTQASADVTGLTLIQNPSKGCGVYRGIELVVAAEAPAATVRGVELAMGETITSDKIADLGASGALYAKVAWGGTEAEVLTLPDEPA